MLGEGLLTKDYVVTGGPGRPAGIYRPTEILMNRIRIQPTRPMVIMDFDAFRSACKYQTNGDCSFASTTGPCATPLCHFLHRET